MDWFQTCKLSVPLCLTARMDFWKIMLSSHLRLMQIYFTLIQDTVQSKTGHGTSTRSLAVTDEVLLICCMIIIYAWLYVVTFLRTLILGGMKEVMGYGIMDLRAMNWVNQRWKHTNTWSESGSYSLSRSLPSAEEEKVKDTKGRWKKMIGHSNKWKHVEEGSHEQFWGTTLTFSWRE